MEKLIEKQSKRDSLPMDYKLRYAESRDVPFLVETIIAAEKSGTDYCGLCNLLNLSLEQIRTGLDKILREEIEGCEFSLTEFAVATVQDQPVAAFCGWIEGDNEDQQSSATLKSNLLVHAYGTGIIPSLQHHKNMLNSIQIPRTHGAHQVEYAYVHPQHRGNQLIDQLVSFLLENASTKKPNLALAEAQVYANNLSANRVYERLAYEPKQKAVYSPEINAHTLPFHEKWMLQKKIR